MPGVRHVLVSVFDTNTTLAMVGKTVNLILQKATTSFTHQQFHTINTSKSNNLYKVHKKITYTSIITKQFIKKKMHKFSLNEI
jgi:hypothetical protein